MIRALVAAALCTAVVAADEKPPSAEVVLRELKAGNDHHVTKRYQHPHQSAARQRELAAGQAPHAIVLSCADSRSRPRSSSIRASETCSISALQATSRATRSSPASNMRRHTFTRRWW
jgi:hypothetical protein